MKTTPKFGQRVEFTYPSGRVSIGTVIGAPDRSRPDEMTPVRVRVKDDSGFSSPPLDRIVRVLD